MQLRLLKNIYTFKKKRKKGNLLLEHTINQPVKNLNMKPLFVKEANKVETNLYDFVTFAVRVKQDFTKTLTQC